MNSLPLDFSNEKYNSKKHDPILFEIWEKERVYAFNKNSKNPIFTIDTPPPYANASWHMGGAIHYSGIDMIARYKRMRGHEILFPMCLDRNGLPIEVQAEKEFKISMHKIPREEFLDKCKQILDRVGAEILTICRELGFSNNSLNWDEIYKTDYPEYRSLTQDTFIEMFKQGLIYEDDRPNNFCPRCQTTIADNEIDYETGTHLLYEIEFKIKETNEPLIIATSRPELIPAIGVIIFNPNDSRYNHLEGKTAIAPLFDIEIPIKAHHYAKMEFGTGILMVCAYGDIGDVQIFRELNLIPNVVIDKDGSIKDTVPNYAGMKIKQARKKIAEDLDAKGLIKSKNDVSHNYPTCSRCSENIEFLAMPEFYLKQMDYVEKLKQYAQELEFHPPYMRNIWLDWLNNVSIDWPISRRRYYGTEVPLWYCNNCGAPNLPEKGQYYQPWRDEPPFKKCQECAESKGFTGDKRTFDTWMDSSISAYYITLNPHNKKDEKIFKDLSSRPYICDLRPQGKDIVRTWLHYSMLRAEQLFNKPMFKHAWISGHVVDSKGEKMSKSRGNIIKPEIMIEKYGGDALRLFGALEASHGSDIRFNEQRLQGVSKFINKFYNISRFISNFPKVEEKNFDLSAADEWILSELRTVVEEALKGYEIFDFSIPAKVMKNFTWEIFASHYLELVKGRAYNKNGRFEEAEQKAAYFTLHKVLDIITKYFAPLIPFVSDYIYRSNYGKTVHIQQLPEPHEICSEIKHKEISSLIVEINSEIWKLKKELKLALNAPIKMAYFPNFVSEFIKDLSSMHSIESVVERADQLNNAKKIKLSNDTEVLIII